MLDVILVALIIIAVIIYIHIVGLLSEIEKFKWLAETLVFLPLASIGLGILAIFGLLLFAFMGASLDGGSGGYEEENYDEYYEDDPGIHSVDEYEEENYDEYYEDDPGIHSVDEYEEENYDEDDPGIHWVDGYERQDGTEVDGHWRSNPDGDPYNNLNP